MNFDTILFDLDGTLTDPKVGITKSIQYALAKFGIEENNLDSLGRFIGPPLMDTFREDFGFDENRARKAIEYYREYFASFGIYENELYPGISQLLNELKQAGRLLFVATSKPTVFAEIIAKHFGIESFFECIIGSNMDGTRSSKAEVIGHILDGLLEHEHKQIVMVGDRKHDIIGAKATGIDSVGVTYGYGSIEEIKKSHPTIVVATVEELRRVLIP